jgi:ParB family chromosome partitioning protein
MTRPGGLGKGLSALIPTDRPSTESPDAGIYRELPVDRVRPNDRQPRQQFDEDAMVSLTESVRAVGVLQPILVREVPDGYEIVAGERRWRAARRAGLITIPAIVREVDDLSTLAQAVIENVHRHDLHPLEEAAAYQQLLEDFALTHEELAQRVGRSRASVTNTVRLLQLPSKVQRLVAERALSAGHARALLGCADRAFQEQLAQRVVDEGLSVRATEAAVRALSEESDETPLAPTGPWSGSTAVGVPSRSAGASRVVGETPPGVAELEQRLSAYLSTGVHIDVGPGRRGRLAIEFADLDDLERLYRLIDHVP